MNGIRFVQEIIYEIWYPTVITKFFKKIQNHTFFIIMMYFCTYKIELSRYSGVLKFNKKIINYTYVYLNNGTFHL